MRCQAVLSEEIQSCWLPVKLERVLVDSILVGEGVVIAQDVNSVLGHVKRARPGVFDLRICIAA